MNRWRTHTEFRFCRQCSCGRPGMAGDRLNSNTAATTRPSNGNTDLDESARSQGIWVQELLNSLGEKHNTAYQLDEKNGRRLACQGFHV